MNPGVRHRGRLRAHFDALANEYDGETSWRLDDELLDGFRRLLPDGPQCVLDLGCGTGLIGGLLDDHDVTVFGIDLSLAMCALARQRLSPLCGDLTAMPIRHGSCDLLLVRQALHYLDTQQLRRVAEEMFRLATPGGVALSHHFTVEPGEAENWWGIAKAHLQPLRRAILTDEAIEGVMSGSGWRSDARVLQSHARRLPLNDRYFFPSPRFPNVGHFTRWVAETAPHQAAASRVQIEDGYFCYRQSWTLGRFHKEP